MKYGIIDIGSNTIRLVVYRYSGGKLEYLFNQKIFARAVVHKENGRMNTDGVKIINDALTTLKELSVHHDLKNLWCFATASLRNISNTDDVLASIREATELNVDIVSGEKEAELGVAGLNYLFDVRDAISIDLGGGSCEISFIQGGQLVNKTSIDIGSVAVTKACVSGIFPKKKEIKCIIDETEKQINKIEWLENCGADAAYVIGGSARAMCNIHKALNSSIQNMNGYSIFTDDILPLYTSIIDMKTEGVRLADQYCSGRVFTLIPGMIILRSILTKASVPVLRLSRFGVREGYLLDKLQGPKIFKRRKK